MSTDFFAIQPVPRLMLVFGKMYLDSRDVTDKLLKSSATTAEIFQNLHVFLRLYKIPEGDLRSVVRGLDRDAIESLRRFTLWVTYACKASPLFFTAFGVSHAEHAMMQGVLPHTEGITACPFAVDLAKFCEEGQFETMVHHNLVSDIRRRISPKMMRELSDTIWLASAGFALMSLRVPTCLMPSVS